MLSSSCDSEVEFDVHITNVSKNFDDSGTIMSRIRLARIAFTKLQKAIFVTRRVALESKKIAYESLVHCGSMWETTFPRLTHAGLGKPINEDSILLSMHDSALSPCPIRRG
jgi:hypothetical protein